MSQTFRLISSSFAVFLIGVVALNLLLVKLLTVDGAPGVDDVGQHDGYEQRDVEHGTQGELTRTGVCHGQRRLQVGSGGVVCSVVPGRTEQQGQHGQARHLLII